LRREMLRTQDGRRDGAVFGIRGGRAPAPAPLSKTYSPQSARLEPSSIARESSSAKKDVEQYQFSSAFILFPLKEKEDTAEVAFAEPGRSRAAPYLNQSRSVDGAIAA